MASTEPRLLGRGDALSPAFRYALPIAVLQRSRAFWGAEIVEKTSEKTGNPMLLQRSRAFWGAEILPTAGSPTASPSASTEPRLLGRGDKSETSWRSPFQSCFNGAAPFGARR